MYLIIFTGRRRITYALTGWTLLAYWAYWHFLILFWFLKIL
jgi:hypothetical protein